jgi:hypothetical protein
MPFGVGEQNAPSICFEDVQRMFVRVPHLENVLRTARRLSHCFQQTWERLRRLRNVSCQGCPLWPPELRWTQQKKRVLTGTKLHTDAKWTSHCSKHINIHQLCSTPAFRLCCTFDRAQNHWSLRIFLPWPPAKRNSDATDTEVTEVTGSLTGL